VTDIPAQANAAVILQPIAIPTFLAILMMALVSPYARRLASTRAFITNPWLDHAPWLLTAGAIILTILGLGNYFMPWTLLMLIPLRRRGLNTMIGSTTALLLFAPAIWWGFDGSPWRVLAFALLGIGATALPYSIEGPASPDTAKQPVAILTSAAALAVLIGMLTGGLNNPISGQTAWHHWGAYLSPVEAFLSGGVPYRDFPVQYGIGPTLLLAGTCGTNCWNGIYWVTVALNAAQFTMLCWCVLLLTETEKSGTRLLALAAMLCAVFFWTAFPALMSNAVMTPSVSGMRFAPVIAIVLHILLSERAVEPRDVRGHFVWACGMVWSMETAAWASLIWWSYLALRKTEQVEDRATLMTKVAGIVMTGVTAATAAILTMLVAYRAIFGVWLDAHSFFIYLMQPPGPLPINLIGVIWLALAIVATAVVMAVTLRQSRERRQIYVCLLAYAAMGTYYLSRSHDNNVLNLFAPLILVLLAIAASLEKVKSEQTRQFIRGFVNAVLASMIAFVPLANFNSWKMAVDSGTAMQIGNHQLLDRFAVKPGTPGQIVDAEAAKAINDLRRHTREGIVFFDENKIMLSQNPHVGWTGANNLANTWPLNTRTVEHYIRQGARHYHRPGWILFDVRNNQANADIYKVAYDVVEQRDYGNYRAYRFVPR
jgi:hypothetical protein